MSTSDSGNGNALAYRVTRIEREVDKLEAKSESSFADLRAQLVLLTREVAVFHAEFNAHVRATEERLDQLEESMTDDVRGIRKLLLSTGAGVLLAAITFAISALKVFGGP